MADCLHGNIYKTTIPTGDWSDKFIRALKDSQPSKYPNKRKPHTY